MILSAVVLPLLLAGSAPSLQWTFDEGKGSLVRESASGTDSSIAGYSAFGDGVKGSALAFDGLTSRVVHPATATPAFDGAFTVAAWIAPQEYSWAWTGIVDRDDEGRRGFSLGIDHLGHVGLYAAVNGGWRGCRSREPVALYRWSHIAGAFDPAAGFVVYVDGVAACRQVATGRPTPAAGTDLVIGMS